MITVHVSAEAVADALDMIENGQEVEWITSDGQTVTLVPTEEE